MIASTTHPINNSLYKYHSDPEIAASAYRGKRKLIVQTHAKGGRRFEVGRTSGNQLKYHQGKGDTISAKNPHVETGKPKAMRMEVTATQDGGRAIAM
jgi:hypothetical protein